VLFQDITEKLVFDRPDDPLQFMLEQVFFKLSFSLYVYIYTGIFLSDDIQSLD